MLSILAAGAPAPFVEIRRVFGTIEAAADPASARRLDAAAGAVFAIGAGHAFEAMIVRRTRDGKADNGVHLSATIAGVDANIRVEAAYTPYAQVSAIWSAAAAAERRLLDAWRIKARAALYGGASGVNPVVEIGGGWSGRWIDIDVSILRQITVGGLWGGKAAASLAVSGSERLNMNWSKVREIEGPTIQDLETASVSYAWPHSAGHWTVGLTQEWRDGRNATLFNLAWTLEFAP